MEDCCDVKAKKYQGKSINGVLRDISRPESEGSVEEIIIGKQVKRINIQVMSGQSCKGLALV